MKERKTIGELIEASYNWILKNNKDQRNKSKSGLCESLIFLLNQDNLARVEDLILPSKFKEWTANEERTMVNRITDLNNLFEMIERLDHLSIDCDHPMDVT